jgi:hypothetical protein
MDYTNTHGVRFKLSHGSGGYTVRYYVGTTGRAWPRTFRVFHCPTDECRREMFYILNNTRLCTTCKDKLIDHRSADQEPTCQSCVLERISQSNVDGSTIPDCPVCYHKMMTIDNSKRVLACRHEVCPPCFRRMIKPTHHVQYDGVRPVPLGKLTCPLCRHEGFYDLYAYRQMNPGTTI